MSRETDDLLTPVGSGVVFGLTPEEQSLADTLCRGRRRGLRRPTRRQAAVLAATAALATGGAVLVVWVARKKS